MSSHPPSASAAHGSAAPATWAAVSMTARSSSVTVKSIQPRPSPSYRPSARRAMIPRSTSFVPPQLLVAELAGDLAPAVALGAHVGVAVGEHLVEEHLVEVVGARHVVDRRNGHALRTQRHDELRQAGMALRLRVGPGQEVDVVGV